MVSASDGSQWYQTVSGEGMGAFYQTPQFTGGTSEASGVAAMFPSAVEGTSLRTVDDGVLEATNADGGNNLWYKSAHFDEPGAPHENIQDANGTGWYVVQPHAEMPKFDSGTATTEASDMQFDRNSASVADVEPIAGDVGAIASEYSPNINNAEQGDFAHNDADIPVSSQPPLQSGTNEMPQNGSYEIQYNTGSDNIGSSTGYTPAPFQSAVGEMPHSAPSYVDYETSATSVAD
jgi:hypothetical protein